MAGIAMTEMAALLGHSRTIAVVGHSPKPERVSYQIAQYLRQAGYAVYPVNPGHDEIDGHPCYRSLAAVPVPVDIVNVFRRSQFLPGIIEEAIAIQAKAVWAQQGIVSAEAAAIAQAANLTLVMDRCIKIDHLRLQLFQQ